jgi:ethanolamine permease
MVAEEVEDPKRTISRGYIYGILTLVILALSVMVFTGGIAPWQQLSGIDYPLPAALGIVLGRDSGLTQLFASLGLFGLIASFHGTIIGYSRQIYALAREGYLPSFLGNVNARFQTPHWALIAGGIAGCLALSLGTTDQVIILAALGAVVMYIISMIALFALRNKEPHLERPFKVPAFPYFPAIALAISVLCLIAIVYHNWKLSLWFFGGLAVIAIIFGMTGRHKSLETLQRSEEQPHA